MAKAQIVTEFKSQGADTVVKDTQKVTKGINDVGAAQNKIQENTKKGNEALSEGFDKLDDATGGFLQQLKALALNPYVALIGAVVGAVIAMKEALQSNAEGQKMFSDAMGRVGNVVNTVVKLIGHYLVDAIKEAGGMLEFMKQKGLDLLNLVIYPMVKAFEFWSKAITGDFKGAADVVVGVYEDIKGVVNEVIDGVKALGKAIEENDKIQQKLNDLNEQRRKYHNQNIVAVEELNLALKQQMFIVDNTTLSFDERNKAVEKAYSLTKRLLDTKAQENKLAQEAIKLQAQMNEGRLTQEQEEELANLQAGSIRLRAEALDKGKEFRDKQLAINDQALAATIAEDAKIGKLQIRTAKVTTDFKLESIDKEIAKKQSVIPKFIEADTDCYEAQVNGANEVAKNTASLLKEGSKEQKAMMISAGLMDTYAATIAAYKSAVSIPLIGTGLAPLAAAAAFAVGMKNVNMIRKQGGGGGGGAGGSAATGSAMQVPKVVNQAPQMAYDMNTQTVKAYIVEDDLQKGVANKQSRDNVSKF